MGQLLHGCCATTEAVRRAIQQSRASVRAAAARYGVNPKTVLQWRRRPGTADLPMGPKSPASTVLTPDEEAGIVAFRRHTLLPLDDCLYALGAAIPTLTRPSPHRCFRRHGIGRLPDVDGDKPAKQKFEACPIGYFHVDLAEARTAEGKPYPFVAIDRTSEFAFVRLVPRATTMTARAFLEEPIVAVPYKTHTILTDNGTRFADPPRYRGGGTATSRGHPVDRVCRQHKTEHRPAKPNRPWTDGRVERTNRTIKEATVRRYHYDTHDRLRRRLDAFTAACDFARRLKTLRGLTPHEFVCKKWLEDPGLFHADPNHHSLGLYT